MSLIAGRYEIQAQIGSGAVGTVYRCLDTVTGDTVAIKHLKPEVVANDPDMVERFAREAEVLRQLNHPHIVKVLDTFEYDNEHYIVMEYVGGGSLRDVLLEQPRLPVRKAMEIALDLADALTRAHRLRIIHRDIKPANILIALDGTLRLSDFGVALLPTQERMTETGASVGTLDYMPPEALNGEVIDTRVDVWSFGVTLFEMLAGQRPFVGDTVTQVLLGIMTQPSGRLEALCPEAPIDLVHLIYRMLEKDPEARINSIRQTGLELEGILNLLDETAARAGKSPFDTDSNPRLIIPPHNLPDSTQTTITREAELPELSALLDKVTVRLVTLTGPAGNSKSALAVVAGWKQMSHFPHGVFCIDMALLQTVEDVLENLTSLLKIELRDDRGLRDQVIDFVKRRTMLLIFENCDSLPHGSLVIREILRFAPGVKVIALANEALKLEGENIFDPGYVARKRATDILNTGIEQYKKTGTPLSEVVLPILEASLNQGAIELSPEAHSLLKHSRRLFFQKRLIFRVLMVLVCSLSLVIPSLFIHSELNLFVLGLIVTTFGMIVNSIATLIHTVMDYRGYSRLRRLWMFPGLMAGIFGLLLLLIQSSQMTALEHPLAALAAGVLFGALMGITLQLSIPARIRPVLWKNLSRGLLVGAVSGLILAGVVFAGELASGDELDTLSVITTWVSMPLLMITFAFAFNTGIILGDRLLVDTPPTA